MSAPQWTEHALQRAGERFPGVDLDALYSFARRPSRRERQRIRDACPRSAKRWGHGYKGRYCVVTRCGIVFVMTPREVVITVFALQSSQ